MRVGWGYDVHAFQVGRKLVLGGVEIPYEKGLTGHSDADVLTHALMDALLGAAALGDLGLFFPETTSYYQDISSIKLLRQVMVVLEIRGFVCANVDCTLVAEKPKLSPYREAIREKLAQVLKITKSRVSVKFTTTEGLGFVGRQEGLAAQVCCLIEKIREE